MQADPQFVTEKAYKIMAELENIFSPNDQMVETEMLKKSNKIKLKNVNENPLQMIEICESKKLTEDVIVDLIFNVSGKIYPDDLASLDYVAKKANRTVDYQELINELHCPC